MAIIKINFDKDSLKEAIKEVQKIKKKFNKEITKVFLTKCYEWIKDRANSHILNLNIGLGVIADISESWNFRIEGNIARCYNTEDRAKFIEFGVGIVGQERGYNISTFNGDMSGYEYNTPTRYKDSTGAWIFRVDNDAFLDVNAKNILSDRNEHPTSVRTRGQEAQLYLYNALMDFVTSQEAHRLWQETLKEML